MCSQFKLGMRERVLTVRVVKPRNRFPRETVQHVSLEILKTQMVKAMGKTG